MVGLSRARTRMNDYLTKHGGRATIERKIGGAWTVVAPDVPVMIQTRPAATSVDPYGATSDTAQQSQLSFPYGTDIETGDRLRLRAPEGSAPETMIVAARAYNSMDVSTDVIGAVEETAVETYTVTIERWEEATGAYTSVLTTEAQAVTTDVGARQSTAEGARGTTMTGTLIITPVPAEPIGAGDWILGIPWATAAQITNVRPVVGGRGEYVFSYEV